MLNASALLSVAANGSTWFLCDCDGVSEAGLLELAKHLEGLAITTLNLSHCAGVTDAAGARALARLNRWRALGARGCLPLDLRGGPLAALPRRRPLCPRRGRGGGWRARAPGGGGWRERAEALARWLLREVHPRPLQLMSAPRVLYEDNHLLGLEKPACMPCVPDASGDESLLDWGKRYIKEAYEKPGEVFLGVVHRLDRPVSGVVLFARTSKAADRLTAQCKERSVEKTYLAVAEGGALGEGGVIEQWLRKDGGFGPGGNEQSFNILSNIVH